MMTLYKFVTADTLLVTQSFSVQLVSFPLANSIGLTVADPFTCSFSPQTLDVADTTYKIECNLEAANTWYTSGSSSNTASVNIVSGSYTTLSTTVIFDLVNIVGMAVTNTTVYIKPLFKNVGWNYSFVLTDSLTYTTDTNGFLMVKIGRA